MAIKELIGSAEGQCEQHQVDHSFRVMWLARRIFELEQTNAPEEICQNPEIFMEALDWAAVLHDREMSVTESYDFDHGKRAAGKVDELIGDKVSPEGREVIRFLCIVHVLDDKEIGDLTPAQEFLLKVFKDADALDRVRFDNGYALVESFMRFESAKELIQEAKELWERTKQGFDSPQAAFDAVFGNKVE
ncbi:MAG: hypothetical protein ABII08_01990 [Candidatus Beckwithbacteria bacterium]